jgi:AcrR family transcriptional regulator
MVEYSGTERTKAKLIQAAGELAAEHGFSNVSTRAVAERSGENIGSIHYHFGGKDGLLEAAVREAMTNIIAQPPWQEVADMNEAELPAKLSKLLRVLVHRQIIILFGSGQPCWHAQVLYQMLQRDDDWYDLLHRELLRPDFEAMRKFFLTVDPKMSEEEMFLRTCLLKLPIFAHTTYLPAILKMLGGNQLSDEYLRMMEDLIVWQTQLLRGLPLDR